MRTGPGQMPLFGPDTFNAQDLDDIARYIQELRDTPHRGGLSLGGAGPVTEGFVAVLFALGGIALALRWITARRADA